MGADRLTAHPTHKERLWYGYAQHEQAAYADVRLSKVWLPNGQESDSQDLNQLTSSPYFQKFHRYFQP